MDPIENEEDRKKTVSNINALLDKADSAYKNLQNHRPTLETLINKVMEHGGDKPFEDAMIACGTGMSSSSGNVNKIIQQLASKYCGECKNSFDSLSKMIQKIQASRKELVSFDRNQKEGGKKIIVSPRLPSTPDTSGVTNSAANACRCYGCATAATQHCITLLKALATQPLLRTALSSQGLLEDLLQHNLRRGNAQVRTEVRDLLVLLTKDDMNATLQLNSLVSVRIKNSIESVGTLTAPDLALAVRHEMALLSASVNKKDSCWEQRIKCVAEIFLLAGSAQNSPEITEHVTLPCLRILQLAMSSSAQSAASATKSTSKTTTQHPSSQPATGVTALASRRQRHVATSKTVPTKETLTHAKMSKKEVPGYTILGQYDKGVRVSLDLQKWLAGDPKHSLEEWKKRAYATHQRSDKKPPNMSKMSKAEVRQRYLMEKYASRWMSRSIRWTCEVTLTEETLKEKALSDPGWLKRMLLNPSSLFARQVAANVAYSLATTNRVWQAHLLRLLTSYLPEISTAGENAEPFIILYRLVFILSEC